MDRVKILLVDDENDIIEFLQYNLEKEGFVVLSASTGEEALNKLEQNPDLIILDVMMPGINGFEVCRIIRENDNFKNTPVIFLTACASETDEIKGLEIGADDFIQKPVSPKILIARVNSNLRKAGAGISVSAVDKITEVGPVYIDRANFVIKINDQEIFFPKKEFSLLEYLASKPGKVFKRQQILDDLWGDDVYVVDRTIDVHIRKIREKMGEFAVMLETVKGVGYRFRNI